MRTLYLDCGMGAAGDMLTGALLDLLDDNEKAAFLQDINTALEGKAVISAAPDVKCGVMGTHVTVTIHGEVEGEEHHQHHTNKPFYCSFFVHFHTIMRTHTLRTLQKRVQS